MRNPAIIQQIEKEIQAICMQPTSNELKRIPVLYNFRHSSHGFQNQITVDAFTDEHAILRAKIEVAGVYGSKMLNRFTFKIKTS